MRVAVIATPFADYSFELSRALAREHAVLLLADGPKLDGEGDAAQVSRPPPGLAIARLPQGRWPVRVMTTAYAAAKLVAFRPDLVIAHEHAHPRVTRLHKVAAARAPVHLIVHDPDPHTGRDAVFAQARQQQIAAQRRNARRLYAHGPWCAARLALTAPPQTPIVSIPHGPIMIPSAPPQPPPGEARMLMFGRMEAYKGLDVLLQACRLLQARGAPLALEIRGHGPELDALEGGFRDLPGVTVAKGYASRDDLIAATARADLVLAPYHEATPEDCGRVNPARSSCFQTPPPPARHPPAPCQAW